MSAEPQIPESGYDARVERVARGVGAALALASLGKVFPGLLAGKAEYEGREFSVASFGSALMGVLGREPAR